MSKISERVYAKRYVQQQTVIHNVAETIGIIAFGFIFAWAILDALFPNTPLQ